MLKWRAAELSSLFNRMHKPPVRPSRLRAVAPLLILVACAAPRVQVPVVPYVAPPASTPNARLIVRNGVQAGDTFDVSVFRDPQGCQGPQRVGTGDSKSNPASTTLPAGGVQTLEVLVRKPGNLVCRMRWSFTPAAGRSYVLWATSTPTHCNSSIDDATDPDAIRLDTSQRERTAGANLCLPLAQTKPIKVRSAIEAREDTSDLPINQAPAAQAPTVAKAPAAASAAGRVTDEDLRGLTGR